jgi:hypothetical protein
VLGDVAETTESSGRMSFEPTNAQESSDTIQDGRQVVGHPNMKSKTWETTITHVESWPNEARPLKKRTWITWLFSIGDALLAIMPFYFIRKHSCSAQCVLLIGTSSWNCGGKAQRQADQGQHFRSQSGVRYQPCERVSVVSDNLNTERPRIRRYSPYFSQPSVDDL